jgi:hypothetical protein
LMSRWMAVPQFRRRRKVWAKVCIDGFRVAFELVYGTDAAFDDRCSEEKEVVK